MTDNKCRDENNNKRIRLARTLIVLALILVLGLAILFLANGRIERFAHEIQWKEQCKKNMSILGNALRTYSVSNEGRIPTTGWCDALKETQPLEEGVFLCPANSQLPSKSSYGLNENLLGIAVEKIAPDTVLLFETEEGWNKTGTANTILSNIHKSGRNHKTFILLFDGTIVLADNNEVMKLQWE